MQLRMVETIPNVALTLDCLGGGGTPKGRVIESLARKVLSKTTVALHAIAEVKDQVVSLPWSMQVARLCRWRGR